MNHVQKSIVDFDQSRTNHPYSLHPDFILPPDYEQLQSLGVEELSARGR
jgi:hypothetical protein